MFIKNADRQRCIVTDRLAGTILTDLSFRILVQDITNNAVEGRVTCRVVQGHIFVGRLFGSHATCGLFFAIFFHGGSGYPSKQCARRVFGSQLRQMTAKKPGGIGAPSGFSAKIGLLY